MDVGGTAGATDIDADYGFTCAIVGGGVKCWGTNDFGQLGDGTNNESNVPVTVIGISSATAVAVGSGVSVGIGDGVLLGRLVAVCVGVGCDAQAVNININNRNNAGRKLKRNCLDGSCMSMILCYLVNPKCKRGFRPL